MGLKGDCLSYVTSSFRTAVVVVVVAENRKCGYHTDIIVELVAVAHVDSALVSPLEVEVVSICADSHA